MTIQLRQRDADRLAQALENADKTVRTIREILTQGVKTEALNSDRIIILDIDVSKIQFYQKNRKLAEPNASWGWCFAVDREGSYHEESKELVQALEQYGEVQIDNRVYSLGGKDGKLLNFKLVKN